MSTANQSLSSYSANELPNAEPYKFGIVVAEWNQEITSALAQGALSILIEAKAKPENIIQISVPGSFELTAGASLLAAKNLDAIICLGCVIQGETKHFDFICHAVAQGLTQLTVKHNLPIIFGVLTTDNLQQAIDRSSGKYGNKGIEAAVTALKMIITKDNLK
jgi:6,7-dimethyl-8-ribityllumazine synthase